MTTEYAVTSATARINGQDKTLAIRSITCSDTLRPGSNNQRVRHARVDWERSGDAMVLAQSDDDFNLVFEGTAANEYEPKRYTLEGFRPSTGSFFKFREEALAT